MLKNDIYLVNTLLLFIYDRCEGVGVLLNKFNLELHNDKLAIGPESGRCVFYIMYNIKYHCLICF